MFVVPGIRREPVAKTLDEFNLTRSSVPQATFGYLASLEWIGAGENLGLVGPARTGKSHLLDALGHAAVTGALKVRYFAAADDHGIGERRAVATRSSCATRA